MRFPVWLVGWFCFVLLHIIHLSSLSSRMPLSHSLLFAAPRCSRFFENANCGGPKFTMTSLFPAVGYVLAFFLGEKSRVSWPSALPFTTPTPPPLLSACLGFLAGDGTKLNNDALSSTQNCELPLPLRILISFLFFSFPFPLLALDANPWTIETYPLFLSLLWGFIWNIWPQFR